MFDRAPFRAPLISGFVAAVVWLSPASSAQAGSADLPRAVYLMRHAEKPTSPKDPHLSEAGNVRAGKLAGYFPKLLGSGSLDVIFATSHSKNSNRPVETITPLAEALHLSVNQSFANRDYTSLAAAIRSGSYAGKTVVICWHHGMLPALARALGADNAPAKWPGSSFNVIWKLVYDSRGVVSLQQISEPF
jgi:broad specificity phosphatase PhoE